jgi:hypothetical protein
MKNKIKSAVILIIICSLFLAACFSGWHEDTGTLSIIVGGGNSRSVYVPLLEDYCELTHIITLNSPGGSSHNRKIEPPNTTADFSVEPGEWDIYVRAVIYDDENEEVLIAEEKKPIRVTIKPGRNIPVTIEMVFVGQPEEPSPDNKIEVESWEELKNLILNNYDKEIFIIKEDLIANSSIIIPNGREITLIANTDKDVTIMRRGYEDDELSPLEGPLFVILMNSILTLNKSDEVKQLIIDGNRDNDVETAYGPLISVYAGGTLIMNKNVSLRNNSNINGGVNNGGGVNVAGMAIMNGGEITGNAAEKGGGVYVDNGGTFYMHDGNITSNEADSGGGVCVLEEGAFYMDGGKITENIASEVGGGVYVDGGIFEIDGEYVYGNKNDDGDSSDVGP